MLRRLGWAILVVLLATILGHSQATPGVTVTATMTDGQGNIQKTGYLHWQLFNCGTNVPQVSGGTPTTVVAQQFDMRPNPSTGLISGAVYGKNQIFCGNVTSTEWLVTTYKSSGQVSGTPQYYCLTSPGTFDPAVTQPCSVTPPPPGVLSTYGLFSNPPVYFTNALSATLNTAFNSGNMTWACWDGGNPAHALYPADVTLNQTTLVLTFTFLEPQTGYCVANAAGNGVVGIQPGASLSLSTGTFSSLTSGDCVQAFTGGLLTTVPFPCGGGGGVNVKQIDPANLAGWAGTMVDQWITAATTSLGAGGGTIQIAAGNYTIGNLGIIPSSNVAIVCDPGHGSVLTVSSSFAHDLYFASGITNFGLLNCVLDGGAPTNTNANDIVALVNVSHAQISNNIIRNTIGNGINAAYGDTYVDITKNEIYRTGPALPGVGTGINLGGYAVGPYPTSHILIAENQVHDGNIGIFLQPNQLTTVLTEDIDITHNRVWANANDGIGLFCSNLEAHGPLKRVRTVDNDVSCSGWPANGTGFSAACTAGYRQTGSTQSSNGVGIDYNCATEEQGVISGNGSHDNFFEGIDVSPQTFSVVNTSGTAVTWVSGDHFNTLWKTHQIVFINGGTNPYGISTCSSTISCTLLLTAGVQNGVGLTGNAMRSRTTVSANILYNNGTWERGERWTWRR